MDANKKIKKAYEAILAGDFERAIDCFEQAIAEEPLEAAHYYKLAITCSRSGKLGKALNAAEAASRLAPSHEGYTQLIAHIEAMQLMEQANDLLAHRIAEQGKPPTIDLVMELLEKAVRLDPLSAEAFLFLSAAYEEAGRRAMALRTVREALRLNPKLVEAKRILARLSYIDDSLH
ncbi:MAG: tetratricopeptide repeat protein [Gorillibacterium sp.]|nr:tetratricopeptide repeat protein [Gorillibacterium sp.]